MSLAKRLFARLLPAASRRHERLVGERKRVLFADLRPGSVVVELGAGTGPNFAYFPRGIRWIGSEPNRYLHAVLREASGGIGEIVEADAASMTAVADEAADAVVCTLVLCSVRDPQAVLREALRMLKPGGAFYFLEHVGAARGSGLRVGQRVLNPLWKRVADGCHTCRDTGEALRAAGFTRLELEEFRLGELGPLAPHIMGRGWK